MPRGDGTGPYGTGPRGGYCRRDVYYDNRYTGPNYAPVYNKETRRAMLQNEKIALEARIKEIERLLED